MASNHTPQGKFWVVVGGADKGGILVREGADLSSSQHAERLQYGAIVEEIEIVGERLHYRRPRHLESPLIGSALQNFADEGWVSLKLKGKDLIVPLMPRWHPEGNCDRAPASLTFYAISDVHIEKKANMTWLENMPRFEKSVVIVAGDVGVNLVQLKTALGLFKQKFDHVFYCYGNHDVWISKNRPAEENAIGVYNDSFEKLDKIQELCRELGVLTSTTLLDDVWVVPILGWYHGSWDFEPPLQPPAGKKLARDVPAASFASDNMFCRWPEFENGSDELAEHLDRQNEAWGGWPLPDELLENLRLPKKEREQYVLSFSHFLPRLELMPEKRFLFQPSLTELVGSNYVRKRVQQLDPDVHIFGHSHFPWDMQLDGIRYLSWPLGSPDEQIRRIESYPTQDVENWHPLPFFDVNGWQAPVHEACWFSWMYSRVPRDPYSPAMAGYVKQAFCPDAPEVASTIISHGIYFKPNTAEDEERQAKYAPKSQDSMAKEGKKSAGKSILE